MGPQGTYAPAELAKGAAAYPPGSSPTIPSYSQTPEWGAQPMSVSGLSFFTGTMKGLHSSSRLMF